MGYDLKNIQKGDVNKIRATCDTCGKKKWVRKSWAYSKIKNSGLDYICGSCSSKKNIKKALRSRMVNTMQADYIYLCEEIFSNLFDDKSEIFIAKKLNRTDYHLIGLARDFVASYFGGSIIDAVYNCADSIEAGEEPEIMNLYDWKTELDARALLHLDTLPRPDGLV